MIYAVGTMPLSIALAIAMALWVNSRISGRGLLRLAYFTPTVLPMIAVANIWLFFYTPQYGLLEQITQGLGLASHNWLGDKHTVLGALIVVAIWKEAGFFMIFYLAALQQISPSLAEAAALEGASRWQYFRRVLFPLLMPTTLFVLINALINSVRMVDHIFVMTRGGPDSASTLLLYYIYQVGFSFSIPAMRRRSPSWCSPRSAPSRSSSCASSTGERTTNDRERLSPGTCSARARDRGGVAARGDVDPAARLRGVDGLSSGRVLDALRARRAADAAELRQRLECRAVRRATSSTP